MDSGQGKTIRLLADRAAANPSTPEAAPAAGIVYGLIHGQREAGVLRLIRRSGKPFSLPYGLMPIVWGDWLPLMILIEYAGYGSVRLIGDALDPLETFLSDRRVSWIRACTEAEAAALPLAVTAIDFLHTYPSRDIGKDAAAWLKAEPA